MVRHENTVSFQKNGFYLPKSNAKHTKSTNYTVRGGQINKTELKSVTIYCLNYTLDLVLTYGIGSELV